MPTIPMKIALDTSNNYVNSFGGVGFSILLLSLHYEATQFLSPQASRQASKMDIAPKVCCCVRSSTLSAISLFILGDWWGKPSFCFKRKSSVVKAQVGEGT